MDASQFGRLNATKAAMLQRYFASEALTMVVRETLRFIDDNFRMQGWQGASFVPWAPIKRPGTILVKTGALRRSFNSQNRGNGEVYFYNNLPYAKVHNEGFNGVVNVRIHSRSHYFMAKASSLTELTAKGKHKVKTILNKTGESEVAAHTRQMHLIQRQFAPIEGQESPVLDRAIIKYLEQDIKGILTF